MDFIIGSCDKFLREVKERVYDILSSNVNYIFKLKIMEYRSKLSKKFNTYVREKSWVKLDILKFDDVPKEILPMSLSLKLVDATLLKVSLRGAFEEVINAA